MTKVLDLDAATYQKSTLHAEERVWVEKNCYIDLWIEVLHSLKLDPHAVMPFTVAVDFEGDQWTFFKPPHTELYDLYGVDVQELTVWKPLVEHAVAHVAAGKMISTEADSFYLPDTSATDYRRTHTKTTIVIQDIDVERKRLGYFHNAGYFALEGEDFVKLFRLDAPADPTFMPLYAELVRVDAIVRRPKDELAEMSRALLRKYLARRPKENPITRFAASFEADLAVLHQKGLEHYHLWAFAGVRQLGAAMELTSLNLSWLADPKLEEPAAQLKIVSEGAKAFILKAARAVNAKRALDARATFADLAAAYDAALHTLEDVVGS